MKKMKYVLKFWYWHQEIIIDDIKPEELIWSAFFPEDLKHEQFIRDIRINGYNDDTYPIQITFSDDLTQLLVFHLIENDEDNLDTRFGDNGITKLGPDFWILDYVENEK